MGMWTGVPKALALTLILTGCGGGGEKEDPTPESGFALGLAEHLVDGNGEFQKTFGASSTPTAADWTAFLPPIGNQGGQGSCVGWATAYYVKSAFEARGMGWSVDEPEHQFSPAWIYNQINGGADNGSQPSDALELIATRGAASLATMPYDDGDFTSQPSQQAHAEADCYPNVDWHEHSIYDSEGMMQYLATNGPMVLGIMVHRSFTQAGADHTDNSGEKLGLHAIACVGFDRQRNGGSFLLANSWGTGWGQAGSTWCSTAALEQIYFGAWTMDDGPNACDEGGTIPAPGNFEARHGTASLSSRGIPSPKPRASESSRRSALGRGPCSSSWGRAASFIRS